MKPGDNKKKVSHQGVSRRGFLKSAAIGAAAVTGADLLKGQAEATEDSYYPATTSPSAELDDRYYDNLSGQQAYKCFACRVRKV